MKITVELINAISNSNIKEEFKIELFLLLKEVNRNRDTSEDFDLMTLKRLENLKNPDG